MKTLTKAEILERRISIVRKRKKIRPKSWHTVLRQKRKAGRRARGITLGQRRKR